MPTYTHHDEWRFIEGVEDVSYYGVGRTTAAALKARRITTALQDRVAIEQAYGASVDLASWRVWKGTYSGSEFSRVRNGDVIQTSDGSRWRVERGTEQLVEGAVVSWQGVCILERDTDDNRLTDFPIA